MHSFEVSLGYESVDRTTFSTCRASLKMYFGQRFHNTPMKLKKNACNSYIFFTLLTKDVDIKLSAQDTFLE